MHIHELKQPIESPNKVSIARGLCSLVESLPPDINTERGCLEDAFTFLDAEPPNVSAALDELTRVYAHSFLGMERETQPEVRLIAVAVELLR